MKTLDSLGLRTSLIAATVTAATVVGVAPAQAAVLSGSVGLSGNINVTGNPSAFTWEFSNNEIELNDTTGDFADLSFAPGSSLPSISNLDFTCTPGSTPFSSDCSTDPVTPFINFGQQTIDGVTDSLTFNLDAGTYKNFGLPGTVGFTSAFPNITGSFMFNGETLAAGLLNGNYAGSGSTYNIQLTTQKQVPEPLTTLGTGLALGFGGLFQRKHSRKRKNQ